MSAPRIGTPAERQRGLCECGDPADLRYDGREWCAFCALFCVGDHPATDLFRLAGEPQPKRGLGLRSSRLVSV